jgi:hypothetical protein
MEQHTNIKFIKLTLQDRVLGLTTWTCFTGGTRYHEELEPLDEEGDSEWRAFSDVMDGFCLSNARSYRQCTTLCEASNQPQLSHRILRTHCPKISRLRSVIRSKSYWRKKLTKKYIPNKIFFKIWWGRYAKYCTLWGQRL